MLVRMERQTFEAMDDASLLWACIEPTIRQIRGRNPAVKTDAYAQLSAGQRALLMFQILYGHSTSGVAEFYCLVPHLPSKEGIWGELKAGMRYFGDRSMVELLGEMEAGYATLARNPAAQAQGLGAYVGGLEEGSEPLLSIRRLDARLLEAVPLAIGLIGAHIRSNPAEFVQFAQ